ncbi:hypothetical protein TIFTF001_023149 [Ficus carica]|uniref:Uncharacterized protein n=1 Tax=Ficus carica TaxID=3494 RepID=A0AA88DC93_FICCA|nr:hypothetical protein TIFTF001_023149 [Ficus carica]
MKDCWRLKSSRGNGESERSDFEELHREDSHHSVATRLYFQGECNASAWEIFLSSRSPLAEEIHLQSPGDIATIHSLRRLRLQPPERSRTSSRR